MTDQKPNDPVAIALSALAATLVDDRRAQRFIALTGIGTDELRRRANDPSLLSAVIGFLEAHEPDLIDVAEAVGVEPAALSQARRELEGNG